MRSLDYTCWDSFYSTRFHEGSKKHICGKKNNVLKHSKHLIISCHISDMLGCIEIVKTLL